MIEYIFALLCSLSLAALVRERRSSCDRVPIGLKHKIIPYRLKLDRHVCIVGPTRSGKSSIAKHIVRELLATKRVVVTLFDWHGEYDVEDVPSIPFSSIGIDVSEIPTKLLAEVLGYGLNLNEPSIYMLYKILRGSKYSDVSELIRAVDDYLVTTRTEAEMKAAILRRLEYVMSSMRGSSIDVSTLMRDSYIVDLSDLTIIEEKRLATSLILAAMYSKYIREGLPVHNKVRHVIVVEEAQNLLLGDFTIVDHVVMELGKYGVRIVLVSNTLPRSYLIKHCSLIVLKSMMEMDDGAVIMSSELREMLRDMSDDEALVVRSDEIVKIRPYRDRMSGAHVRPGRVESVNSISDGAKRVLAAEREGVNDVRDVSEYIKKISDLELRIESIKNRLNELERVIDEDEKIIESVIKSALQSRG